MLCCAVLLLCCCCAGAEQSSLRSMGGVGWLAPADSFGQLTEAATPTQGLSQHSCPMCGVTPSDGVLASRHVARLACAPG
jgi:hypothetical protein